MEQLQKILEEIVLTGTDKYARTRAIYAIKNKTLLISLLDKLKSKDYNYKDIIITANMTTS